MLKLKIRWDLTSKEEHYHTRYGTITANVLPCPSFESQVI